MHIRAHAVLVVAVAGFMSLTCVQAAERERPYHSNVSDIEVDSDVKGVTYNKGPVDNFSSIFSSKKSSCPCACATEGVTVVQASATTTTAPATATAPAATEGKTVKYILDGKPVYEDGAKGETGFTGAIGVAGDENKVSEADIKNAIQNLGNAGWRDAQALLVKAGKDAVPALIDALGQSGVAFNLGGHTKADSGRALRQLTIADVCAELLNDIVGNRSNYQGELPGADQKAWQDWWAKNSGSVTFGG